MTMLSCFSARRPPRGLGGLPGFLDGDEAQGERLPALGSDEDRPIDQPAVRRLAEFGEKIDRLPIGVEPAGVPKSRRGSARQPLIEHDGDAVGLQIGATPGLDPGADADLAFDHRNPIERLAPMLIGELEMAESLGGKDEGAVNAPQLVPPLGRRFRLWDRGRVDDADQAAAACLRRGRGQRLPDQERHPVAAPAQALKQRDIGKIGKPRRSRPDGGRSQPSIAEAIGQDQAQQIHGGCDGPRPQEVSRALCSSAAATPSRPTRPSQP